MKLGSSQLVIAVSSPGLGGGGVEITDVEDLHRTRSRVN